jgi:hypothetical protein
LSAGDFSEVSILAPEIHLPAGVATALTERLAKIQAEYADRFATDHGAQDWIKIPSGRKVFVPRQVDVRAAWEGESVVLALGYITPASDDTVALLLSMSRQPSGADLLVNSSGFAATDSLGRIVLKNNLSNSSVAAIIAALREIAQDKRYMGNEATAERSLSMIALKEQECMPDLMKALVSHNHYTQNVAVETALKLGPSAAKQAIATLSSIAANPKILESERIRVPSGLSQFGPRYSRYTIKAIIDCLSAPSGQPRSADEPWGIRQHAASQLVTLGKAVCPYKPQLRSVANGKDKDAAALAQFVLAKLN